MKIQSKLEYVIITKLQFVMTVNLYTPIENKILLLFISNTSCLPCLLLLVYGTKNIKNPTTENKMVT